MYLDPFDVCYFGQKGQTVYSAATATMILLYHTESDKLKEKSEELFGLVMLLAGKSHFNSIEFSYEETFLSRWVNRESYP